MREISLDYSSIKSSEWKAKTLGTLLFTCKQQQVASDGRRSHRGKLAGGGATQNAGSESGRGPRMRRSSGGAGAGDLDRGGFQPRLPTSLPPPGQQQQQQPSPLLRRQPVPLMPPAQLHPGAPQVVALAPAVPLQSPPPSEQMDVDPSAGPPSHAVAVPPVLQPLSLGTPKEYDTAAPCPAPTKQLSTQRQETLPLFVGPDAPSRPLRLHAARGQWVRFPPSRGLRPAAVSAPERFGSLEFGWNSLL
ncbi:uncharacterized protein LOC126426540 [Schistocerca serialis cubense]|uniref:uncharacterized protein LOC126426540 n=1 Tax=Schistocerca serialis cubense TaxID=2023355 RepID=UPI00214F55F7|nr:uncharacterized protein LOC126426540 [Schistocerca serialis cubense]